IGDGAPWAALDARDLVGPAFGRGALFGRHGVLLVAGASDARHAASFPAPDAPPLALDLRGRTMLVVSVAARGDASELTLEVVFEDGAKLKRRLRSKRGVVRADGVWRELRVPLVGDAFWERAGDGFDW